MARVAPDDVTPARGGEQPYGWSFGGGTVARGSAWPVGAVRMTRKPAAATLKPRMAWRVGERGFAALSFFRRRARPAGGAHPAGGAALASRATAASSAGGPRARWMGGMVRVGQASPPSSPAASTARPTVTTSSPPSVTVTPARDPVAAASLPADAVMAPTEAASSGAPSAQTTDTRAAAGAAVVRASRHAGDGVGAAEPSSVSGGEAAAASSSGAKVSARGDAGAASFPSLHAAGTDHAAPTAHADAGHAVTSSPPHVASTQAASGAPSAVGETSSAAEHGATRAASGAMPSPPPEGTRTHSAPTLTSPW